MPLTFPDGQRFATGATSYHYRPATAHETTPRIILHVEIEGILTEAMLDTGGVYLVCHPHLVTLMDLDAADATSGPQSLLFRGVVIHGRLHRLQLTILPDDGEPLDIQATAFVPEPGEEESWGDVPSILGLYGCLERLRFAVDPTTEMFYFGPASGAL